MQSWDGWDVLRVVGGGGGGGVGGWALEVGGWAVQRVGERQRVQRSERRRRVLTRCTGRVVCVSTADRACWKGQGQGRGRRMQGMERGACRRWDICTCKANRAKNIGDARSGAQIAHLVSRVQRRSGSLHVKITCVRGRRWGAGWGAGVDGKAAGQRVAGEAPPILHLVSLPPRLPSTSPLCLPPRHCPPPRRPLWTPPHCLDTASPSLPTCAPPPTAPLCGPHPVLPPPASHALPPHRPTAGTWISKVVQLPAYGCSA